MQPEHVHGQVPNPHVNEHVRQDRPRATHQNRQIPGRGQTVGLRSGESEITHSHAARQLQGREHNEHADIEQNQSVQNASTCPLFFNLLPHPLQ